MVERILTEEKTKEQLEKEKKNPLFQKPISLWGDPFMNKNKPNYREARWQLVATTMQAGVESSYYWILDNFSKTGHYGFGLKVDKIKDLYAAGVTSAFWGSTEQRKALQQEKAMNFLATIGKMTKDSFQIVRELRIIDERLSYYYKSEFKDDKGKDLPEETKTTKDTKEEAQSAEIALKGTWIDMVEGGAKNPASVYGLATQVGFTILPDLFFRFSPKTTKDIFKDALKPSKDLGINEKVREVLKRKLVQYLTWKEKTYAEIRTRRGFVLKYLRQHYNVIKTYMHWLRPYLRNIRQLQMEGTESPELASAFETSRIELELIGIKESYTTSTPEGYTETHKFKKYFPGIRVKINFTAMPHMAYQTEAQRGAIHLGKADMIYEAFVVTKEDIAEYKKKQDEEDFELIESMSGAMTALGEEFFNYLKEAGEIEEEKEEVKKESIVKGIFSPFTSIISGFKDIVGLEKVEEKPGEIKISASEEKREKKAAAKIAIGIADKAYEIYKKAHGMMTPK